MPDTSPPSFLLPDDPQDARDEPQLWDTRLLWASLFASLALYAKVPNLDIWFSQRYYRPGTGFVGQNTPWIQWVHAHVPAWGYGLLALAGVFLIVAPWLKRRLALASWRPGLVHAQHSAMAGILAAALCSGLIVHAGLKEWVGRPRPVETVEFGGSQAFIPVFERGQNPDRFKGFVSGHATTGFLLMSLGIVSAPRWRYRWLAIGTLVGCVVGLARIMQGAHFLGDVVFAFHATWLSCEAVGWFMRRPWVSRWLPR